MKRGENWFPNNYEQILTWIIFGPSHSRYVPLRAKQYVLIGVHNDD